MTGTMYYIKLSGRILVTAILALLLLPAVLFYALLRSVSKSTYPELSVNLKIGSSVTLYARTRKFFDNCRFDRLLGLSGSYKRYCYYFGLIVMIEIEPIVFLFVIVTPFVMAYLLWDALSDRKDCRK